MRNMAIWLGNLLLYIRHLYYPSESEAIYSICQHVTQERRVAIQCRKIGVHVRALPVRHLNKNSIAILRKSNLFILVLPA